VVSQNLDAVGIPGDYPGTHSLVPEDRGVLAEFGVERIRIIQSLSCQRIVNRG
jgi:hypothetical protein